MKVLKFIVVTVIPKLLLQKKCYHTVLENLQTLVKNFHLKKTKKQENVGQKNNPNILRVGTTQDWGNKYLERKNSERALYDFNVVEIQKFIYKFFKNNNFKIQTCKINYSNNGLLNIFISYAVIIEDLKEFEIKVLNEVEENIFLKLNQYKLINYIEILKKKSIKRDKLDKIKYFKQELRTQYFTKINPFIKTNPLEIKTFNPIEKNFNFIEQNLFLTFFFESLFNFLKKKVTIYLTLQQLNPELENLNKKKTKFLKKSIAKLHRYKENNFFEEGIELMYICTQYPNSANLLAEFIATHLKKLKRHNYFLRFIKKSLTILKKIKNSKIKNIKIKIKGRLNRRPRARYRLITVGKKLPILTLKSNINYAEKTAYTSNGTLGVKIWIYNQ